MKRLLTSELAEAAARKGEGRAALAAHILHRAATLAHERLAASSAAPPPPFRAAHFSGGDIVFRVAGSAAARQAVGLAASSVLPALRAEFPSAAINGFAVLAENE